MDMALKHKEWTLDELHRLPDDGNKYELVRGELFVTPAPTEHHETIAARLSAVLTPFVLGEKLGLVYHPRAIFRREGSEVEPDLMVRLEHTTGWDTAPKPILIIEVLSDSTRRRDRKQKRELYMDSGIAEYWIVDAESQTIEVTRPGAAPESQSVTLVWAPHGATRSLTISVPDVFG